MESYQIYHWSHGEKRTITSHDLHAKIIQSVQHITDRPRLFVNAERIEDLLLTEEAWDLVYDSPETVQVGMVGPFYLQQIVIPLTGDLTEAGGDGGKILLTLSSEGHWDIWITRDRW